MLTPEKTLEARQNIASQITTLSNLTVKDLLKLLRATGLSGIDRNGKNISIGSARKAELLEAAQRIAAEAIAVQESDINIGLRQFVKAEAGTNNDDSFAYLGRKVATEICKLAFQADIGKLKQAYLGINSLAADSLASFRNLFEADDKQVSSLYRYRTKFFNATARAMSELQETKPDSIPDNWLEWYANFKDAFQGLTSHYTVERKEVSDSAARTKNVDNDAVRIKIEPVLDRATRVLESLDHLSAGRWTDVTTALMIATGRRPSELHTTAQFEIEGKNQLIFNGQLKTRDAHEVKDLHIPTLVDASLCAAGLQWLKDNGKRIEPGTVDKSSQKTVRDESHAAEMADRRYSSPLSQNFKNWIELFEADYGSTPEKQQKKLRPYDCRGFYVKRCQQVHTKGMTPAKREAWASGILGHVLKSDGSDPAVRAYDSGFVFAD